MIIDLTKSHLFTIDPDKRFAKRNKQPLGLWNLMYRRAKLLNYTTTELCDLQELKTGTRPSESSIIRWVWRSDVYYRAQDALSEGAKMVVSSYFGDMEWSVIKELTKNMKNSATTDVKALP